MNDLRLILLLLGAVVIVCLYLWDRLQRRLARRRELPDADAEGDAHLVDGLKIPVRGGGDEEDFSAVLSALKPGPATTGLPDAGSAGPAELPSGNIITLHVMADPQNWFTGPAVLSALKEEGLEFGDMGIFHHYGLQGMRSGRPLFHLANMVEPGYLAPDNMADFTTPGLSLFMLLPTPVDGGVVLDLMLVSARMLARRLGGTVVTHDRKPLTEEYILHLREHIYRHGQSHGG